MDPSVLAALDPATLEQLLPSFLASKVENADAQHVEGLVAGWSSEDYRCLLDALRSLGSEHRVYPALPHCRALARAWMVGVIRTEVAGIAHLEQSMAAGRTVIVTNHISYVDAVATDAALFAAGHTDLADRIVYLAGPKVYQELFRLVAAACIHSLPVPQSNQVSHTETLTVRELARRALASVEAGQKALDDGYALLFYPEGSRTRSGRLEPFLQATRRYVQAADYVVPAAIVGTEQVMPLDSRQMHPGRVSLTFGAPIPVEGAEGAREVLAAARESIVDLLPEPFRPLSDTPALV